MNDWFKWNGVKCTEYGIHVTEQPPVTLPAERVTYTNVPGRAGSLATLEADDVYDDMILAAQCVIANPSKIPEIAAWLKGSGTVTFANRQGGYYNARITNQISFDKILRGNPHCSFTVNFRCTPFWYLDANDKLTFTESTFIVKNPGSVDAEPVITLYGSGDINLSVGSQLIELTDLTDCITLDTPLMEVYNGKTNMNGHMSGEFLVLKPGANAIGWTGDVTKVEIVPNWRTL